MNKRLSETNKRQLVEQYHNGNSVSSLSAEAGIPQSTIYSWIKQHPVAASKMCTAPTPKEFDSMKRRNEKLAQIVTILKTVRCTASAELKDKLYELESLPGQFSVANLCYALDVPRGTYYNHILRNKRDDTTYMKRREELRIAIKDVFDDNRQIFGAGKIRAILVSNGYRVSVKMVSELMKEMGICSIRGTAKRNYKKLELHEKKTNILRRNFDADKPNRVWVSDVTCFKFSNKFFYICIIIDLYSRKAISYRISMRNSTQLITSAFKDAHTQRTPSDDLLFHSDRGTQYTSYSFQSLLKKHGIKQSFSNPGKPHDNAVAESFFSSMKQEELYRMHYRSEGDFKNHVAEYIEFYNTRRPHTALNYKTPEQMENELKNEVI